jgi:hypothetical protein
MQQFKKINTSEYETNIIQDNVERVVNQIVSSPIIDGILLSGVSLIGGQDNYVSHKLQRVPRFWIIARQDSNVTVWEDSTKTDSSFLDLKCSGNCTINLWVG